MKTNLNLAGYVFVNGVLTEWSDYLEMVGLKDRTPEAQEFSNQILSPVEKKRKGCQHPGNHCS